MATRDCCCSGGHSHHVGCVYGQLCEEWKGKDQATVIGKTILPAVPFGVSGIQEGNVALLENQALWHINYCTHVQGASLTQQPQSKVKGFFSDTWCFQY